MPHKSGAFWEWLRLLFSTPHEALDIALTLVMGELGRWCLGGGKFRERLGDLIICLLVFYLVRPWIPVIPPVFGVQVRPAAVAIAIALLGSHGVGQILAYYFKKRTGISLTGEKNG